MKSIYTSSINIPIPPVSGDVDINPSSVGIEVLPSVALFDRNTNSNANRSYDDGNIVRNKRKSLKIDSVSLTEYCLDRLSEIRRINELSHTPSAYSCLMSFIGFLAPLVYENDRHEVDAYTKFIHEYMKELYCARIAKKKEGVRVRASGHNKNNSWGEVIYSFVRCGLVHNMNVTGKKNNNQEQIKVMLTHEAFRCKDCRVYKFGSYDKAQLVVGNDETIVLVINAFDLCDAVRKAIIRMFQKAKVRASARRVLKLHPIIRQIS